MEKENSRVIISSVIIILLIAIVVVIFIIPFSYTATQQYVEKVPYDAQESYTEKEPFRDCRYREASYSAEWGELFEDFIGANYIKNELLVTNNEDKSLKFSFTLAYHDKAYFELEATWLYEEAEYADAHMHSYIEEKIILPHQTESFMFYMKKPNPYTTYYTKYRQFYRPTIEECETNYRDVTKYRTVTKYKDEYKEESITKYATLFNQWTGKVKWYYESNTPLKKVEVNIPLKKVEVNIPLEEPEE